MCVMKRLRQYLAERRDRRRRYAETLELFSLPVEIQNDIIRPEPAPVQRAQLPGPRSGA